MAENVFTRVVDWLRAGYPDGLPAQDYVPLLDVLARRLTADEVQEVAHELVLEGLLDASDDDIRRMIGQVVLTPADEKDVRRVAARLAAGGWPLGEPA